MTNRLIRIATVWLLLATAWVVEPYVVAYWASATSPRAVTPRADLTEAERTTIKVFQTASPSVVHVFARANQALPCSSLSRRLCNPAPGSFGMPPVML